MRSRSDDGGNARCRLFAITPALLGGLVFVSSAAAHDFWLIPHLFAFTNDSMVHVNGKSGVAFPRGSAVQPTRVADAWLIGAGGRTRITHMSVQDSYTTSLRRPANI